MPKLPNVSAGPVAFPSREAAKKTWEAFGKDPEWRQVYQESHKNGVLVKKVESVYLEPTDAATRGPEPPSTQAN